MVAVSYASSRRPGRTRPANGIHPRAHPDRPRRDPGCVRLFRGGPQPRGDHALVAALRGPGRTGRAALRLPHRLPARALPAPDPLADENRDLAAAAELRRRADLRPVSALGAHAPLLSGGRRHGDLRPHSLPRARRPARPGRAEAVRRPLAGLDLRLSRRAAPGDSRMTTEPCPLCGAEAAITVGPVYGGVTRKLWRR